MTIDLPPNIWFVRSNGGSGSYPVTPEGKRVVRQFMIGVALSVAAAVIIGVAGSMLVSPWLGGLGAILFAAGMAWSAWRFIDTARKHTDYTITYNEYVRRKAGA